MIMKYEGYSERSFHRSNGVRAFKIFGRWFGVGFALGVCLVGCLACGIHRESIHVVEVDTHYHSDTDTCTIEVWRQYFPRKVTKFRVKP